VTPVIGFALGILTAVVLAWLLYRRSVKLNLARFFTWTGAGLIVIAAGVLAYAVHDLQEGGVLPGLNVLAFDVHEQIPTYSWYGELLKGVFNFSPQTTGGASTGGASGPWPMPGNATSFRFSLYAAASRSTGAPHRLAGTLGVDLPGRTARWNAA
jgi:hypothetical protein